MTCYSFSNRIKKMNQSNVLILYQQRQRDRRQRALLLHQNFDFLFYLGWSGCFHQSKHNIMKVVQSSTIYFQKCNNWIGVDLNLLTFLTLLDAGGGGVISHHSVRDAPTNPKSLDFSQFDPASNRVKVIGHTWDPVGSPPGQ